MHVNLRPNHSCSGVSPATSLTPHSALTRQPVAGATTTWQGLPSGTYFVELTAESFATGYGDYYIPSSNQVTRQDERTTRIYFNATRAHQSINAYVFAGDSAAS
jgi:hypothetical protein